MKTTQQQNFDSRWSTTRNTDTGSLSFAAAKATAAGIRNANAQTAVLHPLATEYTPTVAPKARLSRFRYVLVVLGIFALTAACVSSLVASPAPRQSALALEPSAPTPSAPTTVVPEKAEVFPTPDPKTSTSTTPTPTKAPTSSPQPSSAPATPTGPKGWSLVWADEFDGSSVDSAKWQVENESTYGDGNQELACLMNRDRNLFVSRGTLTIRAQREDGLRCGERDGRFPGGRQYSSAMLHTKKTADFNYGMFEVRAKLPTQPNTSKGLWPAFWLRPIDGGTGELDVLEAIGSGPGESESNITHHSLHYDYSKTHAPKKLIYKTPGWIPADGFHTYAAQWDPGEIRWYVDGVLAAKASRADTPWIDEAFAANKKFYLRLNMAVGGSWPGSPTQQTVFPADYVVDYVRVYQRS